ncbi:MAG: hypothetical protein Q7R92_01635 [bacterium]|nr:hypothetical protein [bacterium]
MKENEGLATIYRCDHPGCLEKSSGLDVNLKMCEITFGVHPALHEKLMGRNNVETKQISFHFCLEQADFYIGLTLAMIRHALNGSPLELLARGELSNSASRKPGLGCWLTIDYRLPDANFGTKNYQMSWKNLSCIYENFFSLLEPKDNAPFGRIIYWMTISAQKDNGVEELRSSKFHTDSLCPQKLQPDDFWDRI